MIAGTMLVIARLGGRAGDHRSYPLTLKMNRPRHRGSAGPAG